MEAGIKKVLQLIKNFSRNLNIAQSHPLEDISLLWVALLF